MLLQVGFSPIGNAWYRQIEETKVTATLDQYVNAQESKLVFSLSPNIINMEGHIRAATGASLMFKVADRIAEHF